MDYDKWKLDNNESDTCICPICEEEVNEKDIVPTNYQSFRFGHICIYCAEKIEEEE